MKQPKIHKNIVVKVPLIKEGLSEDEGKDGEDKVQQLTNSAIAKVDKILEAKDKEIMTI